MAFFTAILLMLFLLEPCLCEDSVEVVVTTPGSLQAQIRSEIESALSDFTCHTAPSTPQQGACSCEEDSAGSDARNVTEMVIRTIDAISDKLGILQKRLDILLPLGSTPDHPASSCAEILEEYPDSSSGYYWVSNATKHIHRVYCDTTKLGSSSSKPASSCAEIVTEYPDSTSGYYWVSSASGDAHSVYCDMTRSCGGVTGGWMRVAYLDMTNSSHQCPSSMRQRTDSLIRSCAVKTTHSGSCSSVWYLPQGIPYSRVCGRILGYIEKSCDGFYGRSSHVSIYSNYVDGVSLTYGRNSKKHVWTFAARKHGGCPCGSPPAFVGNHYFCDVESSSSIHLANPLWDGKNCVHNKCCLYNNPPWFYRHLSQTTTEDIQMRLCRDQNRGDEDIAVGAVEIYVN